MPAYFARGSGHNATAAYSERADDYVNNLDRLGRKFETMRTIVPAPAIDLDPHARIGVIGYGTSHWAVKESRDQLRNEAGVDTSYLRLKAYPFTPALGEFIDRHDRIYVIEQNRDAQMAGLMRLALQPAQIAKLRSVLHYSGLPIDARSVTDDVLAQEGHDVVHRTHAPVETGSAGVGGE